MEKSKYIEKYKKRMLKFMKVCFPDEKESEMEKILDELIEKKFQNPDVDVDNNYTKEHKKTTLLSVIDWCLSTEPIIAGNGTFYKNQHKAMNPIAKMLEGFLSQRKAYKKEMISKDPSSRAYMELDLKQGNEKIKANS